MEFGFTLFDKRGQLRTKFAREGTGVWGPEVNGSSLLYVENIEVKPRYRGRGIAKKALEMVWQIPEVSVSLFPAFSCSLLTVLALDRTTQVHVCLANHHPRPLGTPLPNRV